MDKINSVEEKNLKADITPFTVGDTIKIHVIIREGEKERIQVFRGDVIAKKGLRIERHLYCAQEFLWDRRRKDFSPPLQNDQGHRSGSKRQSETRQTLLFAKTQRKGGPA